MSLEALKFNPRPPVESFVVSAGIHYLFKRDRNAALIAGSIAASLTIVESMIYPTDQNDDEARVFYKPALIGVAMLALGFFSSRKIDFARSCLVSIPMYWLNHYFIWIK